MILRSFGAHRGGVAVLHLVSIFLANSSVILLCGYFCHVWQLQYEIVRVVRINKHYVLYIESGICSPLPAVGSQIWEGF